MSGWIIALIIIAVLCVGGAVQSLQIDTISGATLTSKAYLKLVGNALIKAQK